MIKMNSASFPMTHSEVGNAARSGGGVRTLKWSILGTDRSQPHIRRKAYHFAMGLFCFGLYAFVLSREEALALLASVGGAWILCDIIRFRFSKLNQATLKLFGPLMRREELTRLTANTFYILGMLAIVPVFPKPVVLLCVLYLAIGDPIAAVVGTRWGKHRLFGKKSLEGSLANFVATAFATSLFASLYLGLSPMKVVGLSLAGGMVSVLAEAFPAPINDNFTIPVLSAILLTGFLAIFPFF